MCEDNKRWEKSRQTWRYALLHKFLPENIEAIKKKSRQFQMEQENLGADYLLQCVESPVMQTIATLIYNLQTWVL